MKHKIGFNKLNMMPAHRKATIRNMMTVLFEHERITTTHAKALEVRRFAEREITRAKEDSVHNRRMVARKIWDEGILAKLFTDIAPRFKERNGGYTRIIRIGERKHDAADMVILELVERKEDDKKAEREKRKAEKKAKNKALAQA
jgi:large subunit ribosomal protein L17